MFIAEDAESLLQNGHNVLFQFLSRKTLELRSLRYLLADKLVIVLSLVLQLMWRGGVLLLRFAARLHRHLLVGLFREGLAVDGLRGLRQCQEYFVAECEGRYSLWTIGRGASLYSMVLVR